MNNPTSQAQQIWHKVWNAENTFMTTMLVAAFDAFGFIEDDDTDHTDNKHWYTWTPATIRHMLEREFGVPISHVNFDRFMAGIAVLTTDSFFKNLPSFIKLVNVIAFDSAAFDEFNPAEPDEMAWAISEVMLLDPPEEDEPFCDDIRRYIGLTLKEEGFVNAPDILRIAIGTKTMNEVLTNYSDDPELSSAIYQNQNDKTKDIENLIMSSLVLLGKQLKELPLRNGDVSAIVKRVEEMVQAQQQEHPL